MVGRVKIAAALILIAILSGVGRLAAPGWEGAIVAGGVGAAALVLGAQQMRWLRAMKAKGHSSFDDALRKRVYVPTRPADLVGLERTLGYGIYEPDEFEMRLKPLLQRVHRHVLRQSKGVDPTRDPDRHYAARLTALHPGRPCDRSMDTAALVDLVDAIEESSRR